MSALSEEEFDLEEFEIDARALENFPTGQNQYNDKGITPVGWRCLEGTAQHMLLAAVEIRRLRAALTARDAAIDDLLVCFVGPTFEMHLRLQAVIDKHNLDPRAAKARASLAAELKEKQG